MRTNLSPPGYLTTSGTAVVNAIPLVAGSGAAPEALPRPLQQAAEELARLVEAPAAPAAFYAEYLRHVQEALGGMSAALWTRERDSFRLDQHSNFAATGLDDTPHGLDCHVEILRRVARRDRPVWLPPGAADEKVDERIGPRNVSPLGALLAPIVLDGDTVGVVEVWLPDSLDAGARRIRRFHPRRARQPRRARGRLPRR
jgi:hypothetical protein